MKQTKGNSNYTSRGTVPVLFINSAAYSGSTLLTRLLNLHPRVATVGELAGYVGKTGRPKQRMCSCGRSMTACPFWNRLAGLLEEQGVRFDPEDFGTGFRLFPYRRRVLNALATGCIGSNRLEELRRKTLGLISSYERQIREVVRTNEQYIRSICRLRGADVFLDASKYADRAKHLSLSRGLDLRIVHLTRDSRGVVNSYRRHLRIPVAAGALKWTFSQVKSESLRRRFPSSFLRLRYEDLCADPLGAVNRVLAFAGLDPLEDLDPARGPGNHILGNRMRLVNRLEIRQDIGWRRDLSPSQVGLVTAITSPKLKALGYRV